MECNRYIGNASKSITIIIMNKYHVLHVIRCDDESLSSFFP
jgi:hypothetical protein